jgi:integrase
LGQIYRSALNEGLISSSSFADRQAPDTSDSQERMPFTAEEMAMQIAAAPSQQWVGMIMAAAFTGLNFGDVARLRWSPVNLQTKLTEVMPSKTKRKKTTCAFLTSQAANLPPTGKKTTKQQFEKQCGRREGFLNDSEPILGHTRIANRDRALPSVTLTLQALSSCMAVVTCQ